jgi:hypothetical protein
MIRHREHSKEEIKLGGVAQLSYKLMLKTKQNENTKPGLPNSQLVLEEIRTKTFTFS